VNKTEKARATTLALIKASCEAGIEAAMADGIVSAAFALLDGIQAELMVFTHGDVTGPIRGQILRSAGSIAANAVEGIGKAYKQDRVKYFLTARGSAYETAIWLRAMGKKELLSECVSVCNMIDKAILAHAEGSDLSEETETS
jgi:four helix bundle protein